MSRQLNVPMGACYRLAGVFYTLALLAVLFNEWLYFGTALAIGGCFDLVGSDYEKRAHE